MAQLFKNKFEEDVFENSVLPVFVFLERSFRDRTGRVCF